MTGTTTTTNLFSSTLGGSPGGPSSPRHKGPVVSLTREELSQFVAGLKPCAGGTQQVVKQPARPDNNGALSILQPAIGQPKGTTLSVPIGHYAHGDEDAKVASGSMRVLELRDTKANGFWGDSSVRLQAALEQALPPAARFQVVWSRGGTSPLTIWSAVPPTNDFVALGMVATATGAAQRPPLELVRCVPKSWTRRAHASDLVYDGAEGSVWRSRHGLLHASKGRHAPQVYELVRDELQLGA